MKLWQKNYDLNKLVEKFNVDDDYLLDQKLVKYDCVASIAHVKMLHRMSVITKNECDSLVKVLNKIIELDGKGVFLIKQEDEDCHTVIENYLVKKLGDVGKKIHTARSRKSSLLFN